MEVTITTNSLTAQAFYCVAGSFIALFVLLALSFGGFLNLFGDLIAAVLLTCAFVPLVLFYLVFYSLENSKGFEFKKERLGIAALLWFAYLLAVL
ncbi:MAG: hypothetical protein LBR56_07420, partial [Sporomusaceae bacterium]|nr:hypothetical protein [Sporomusaceae bacterium]